MSYVLAVGYALTSATLSIANKWALVRFPFPGTLTLLQFGFSAGAVRFLKAIGVLEADFLSFTKVRQFAPAVIMFYAAIAANMRLLSKSTVDTFIVVRSVTPIFTQICEIIFLRADWPSQDAVRLCGVALPFPCSMLGHIVACTVDDQYRSCGVRVS